MSDDEAPFDPVKVTVFVLLLAAIGFAGWRFVRTQRAVAAVAEASKDYRKLFPARSAETPEPAPQKPPEGPAVASGMSMLKVDDDMRTPKPAPAAAPEPPKEEEPAPAAETKAQAAAPAPAPVRPVRKAFNQPRLNSGGLSGLNGGSGVGLTGGGLAGGGGGSSPAPAAAAAAPAEAMPDVSALLKAAEQK